LGWDIRSWLNRLWDTISEISLGYLLGGVALKTLQTTATAFAWYGILRCAYPTTRFRLVLACYAASVALNGILPANLGTFALLLRIASLGVMGVFLAAYDIPVSFHTLMRICGGNSIANVTSATPGGAGVNQAFNVASLKGVTDPTTATAYSVSQQLVTTAWNIIFGVVLLVWAFGWSGGKELVETSYTGAKEKAAEQREARAARKEAKRAAKHA